MLQRESFQCRSCGHTAPHEVVFSLGKLPLGNALLSREQLLQPEATYPLDLAFCERCALLQVREAIPLQKLIQEYLYFTSVSPSLLKHGRELAKRLIESRRLDQQSLVIEVGSNDGTLLECFHQQRIPVLGVEPVAQSARVAEEEYGVPTMVELFSEDLACRLKDLGKSAEVIIANYVLELVPDPSDFVKGVQRLLREDGVLVIEVPYVRDMVEHCRFDGIAHLRLSWFSLTSLDHLLRNQGVVITEVEHLDSFRGGTLRIFASPSQSATPSPRVTSLLQEEIQAGVKSPDFYRAFAWRVDSVRESLRNFLREVREKKQKRVAAYGAGIKASTLLNFCQLGKEFIDFVVDGNRAKHGRLMPGVHLPIYSPQKLLEEMPDYVLLLALDFANEILDRQVEDRRRGVHFIIPVPELSIV